MNKGGSSVVKRALNGDEKAYAEILEQYKGPLYGLILRMVRNKEEAEDLVQEAFIKAFNALPSFNEEYAFSTWLYKIAVNTCNNRIKSLDFRFKKKTNPINSDLDNPWSEFSDESGSPMVELERKERSYLIQKEINGLPKDKRTVVVLRDIEGLSYEEIAVITGLNLGTVKSKLARARQKLRKKLAGVL